jgi:RNA recognition motif-containing protein
MECDIPLDERNKSKGFGMITFNRRKDAEEAIRIMD